MKAPSLSIALVVHLLSRCQPPFTAELACGASDDGASTSTVNSIMKSKMGATQQRIEGGFAALEKVTPELDLRDFVV